MVDTVETCSIQQQEEFSQDCFLRCSQNKSKEELPFVKSKRDKEEASIKFPYTSVLILNESWSWDVKSKSPRVETDAQCKIANFFPTTISEGTAAIRGTRGFKTGIHYFEVKFNRLQNGTSIMIGYGTQNTCLNYENFEYVNLIGNDAHSWGLNHRGLAYHNKTSSEYCDRFNEIENRIGVLVDLYAKQISFYKNGVNLGITFRNIETNGNAIYPMISSTATDVEIEITRQLRIYSSLQELCYNNIVQQQQQQHNSQSFYDCLDIPKAMIKHLKRISS